MTSFRMVSNRHLNVGRRGVGGGGLDTDLPEEGGDLHKHFRTCASLTRIREELRNALSEDEEHKLGFGMNCCARPEDNTGRLLLHSIGLNKSLITSGGGGTAAAVSRVNQFILQELLPVSCCTVTRIIYALSCASLCELLVSLSLVSNCFISFLTL